VGIIVLIVTPLYKKDFDWRSMISLHYLANQLFSLAFSVVFYYFMLNAYYVLLSGKKTLNEYIKPSLIGFIGVLVYMIASYYIFTPGKMPIKINGTTLEKSLTLPFMIVVYFFTAVCYLGLSLLIAYLTYLRDERKTRKVLEEQKMQLEIEKSQANLNFLKSQINPHFLHNTLNFFYAKALPLSNELADGILTLSEIMRYALSEGKAKDGKAPLKDEVEHLRNVIKIQQLRFNNKLNVDFKVEGVLNGASIVPFVLITLAENAFKHGDLKDNNFPITIKLKVENKSIYFYCHNKKKVGPKELSTGIGLDNIKKRLDLAYGQSYRFKVLDEAEFYTTELFIDTI
jgi:sensor histidine kinase YesM